MDIYSAEAQVKRLLEYVKAVSASPTRMYKKTYVRLNELANTCSEVVSVISSILQDKALEECDRDAEFETASGTDIAAVIASMQQQLSELQQFINPTATPALAVTAPQRVEISSATRKHVFADYKLALSSCASASSPYPAIVEICDLLWTWFRSRFVNSTNANSTFQYNIRRWPEWIRDIVVLYGNAVETQTADTFVAEFRTWCNTLSFSEAFNKYAVPYNIYEFNKHLDRASLSLTAVILWDMLMDIGLSKISVEAQSSDLYLPNAAVYDLCEKLAPDVLDNYRYYKTDAAIDRRFKVLRAEVLQ